MKDYYRILQVDPQAEQEVIEAAYRRLMRKYHPDVLSPHERDSEEVLRKVQELNEAYDVLGDTHRRQEYDLHRVTNQQHAHSSAATEPSLTPAKVDIENRLYLVRCSTTKRTFKMLLERRKGWSGPFVVLGFEHIDEGPIGPVEDPSAAGLWGKLRATFTNRRSVTPSLKREELPTPEETIRNLIDAANTLSMGEIEWAGRKCPDCAAEMINPNGTIGTWSRCGTCHRLKCVGKTTKRIDGHYSTCPWCGATNKTTRSVATGSKEQAILRGKYERADDQGAVNLPDRKPRSLGPKKES